MYIKQKRGNFKLKKCTYIQFFLPFRLFLPLVSFLGAKLNYLRASPDVQNMPEKQLILPVFLPNIVYHWWYVCSGICILADSGSCLSCGSCLYLPCSP